MHLQLSGGHSDDTEDSVWPIILWESIFNIFVSFLSAQESLEMAIKKLQTAPWNASLGFRGCSEHFNSQSFKSQTAEKIHFKLMILWIASKDLQLAAGALSKSCLQIALRALSPTSSDCFVFVCSVLLADSDGQKQVAVLSVSISWCHLALPLFGPFVPLALVALWPLGPSLHLDALTASRQFVHHATVQQEASLCSVFSRCNGGLLRLFMVSTH